MSTCTSLRLCMAKWGYIVVHCLLPSSARHISLGGGATNLCTQFLDPPPSHCTWLLPAQVCVLCPLGHCKSTYCMHVPLCAPSPCPISCQSPFRDPVVPPPCVLSMLPSRHALTDASCLPPCLRFAAAWWRAQALTHGERPLRPLPLSTLAQMPS